MATSEIYPTKGTDARELFESTDPVHVRMGKSIFHLRIDCEKCGIGGYGSCFLLQDLSKDGDGDCDGDYVYFATAAHNLYCVFTPEKNPNCETGCNQYCFVKIIERWSPDEKTPVYLVTDNIGKNSKAGWLKVSNKYEKSAKSVQVQAEAAAHAAAHGAAHAGADAAAHAAALAAAHQATLDRYTYDFGVIAARKVDLLDNNPSLLPGIDQQVPVFWGNLEPDDVSAYLCGYPGRVGDHKKDELPPRAKKRKYWVPSASRVVVLAPNLLKHYVHSSGGQSGAPLYKLTPSVAGEAPCVLGIHVGGDPKSNPRDRHNLAVKLCANSVALRTIRGWVLSGPYVREEAVEPVPFTGFEGATSEMIEEPNVFTLPVSMEGDKKPSHSVVHKPQTATSAPGVLIGVRKKKFHGSRETRLEAEFSASAVGTPPPSRIKGTKQATTKCNIRLARKIYGEKEQETSKPYWKLVRAAKAEKYTANSTLETVELFCYK
eukprot:scpid21782/ scgid5388/ 